MQPLVTIDQLWEMATTWYATRLQADSRRPQPDEIGKIFAGIGFQDDCWDPKSDSFGYTLIKLKRANHGTVIVINKVPLSIEYTVERSYDN